MQRILVELIGAREQLVEQRVLALDVADQQRLGELALLLEMIKESALGDADAAISSSIEVAAKSLLQHRRLSRVENALARVAPLALLHVLHAHRLREATVPRVRLTVSIGGAAP
jgi:hypothetical protein